MAEEKKPGQMIPLDPAVLVGLPRYYAQVVLSAVSEEDAQLTLCNRVETPDGPFLVPQAICYMSISHMRRLYGVIGNQLDKLDEAIQQGLPLDQVKE